MKIFAVIWSMLYLVLSSGLSLHLHYCKGDIANISFYQPAKSCCDIEEKIEEVSCCFAEENPIENAVCSIDTKSCCEDFEINFTTFSEKIIPAVLNFTHFDYKEDFSSPSFLVDFSFTQLFFDYVKANAPPDVGISFLSEKLFILFQSLVLYH